MDLAQNLGLGRAWFPNLFGMFTSCLLLCSIFHYPYKPAMVIHLGAPSAQVHCPFGNYNERLIEALFGQATFKADILRHLLHIMELFLNVSNLSSQPLSVRRLCQKLWWSRRFSFLKQCLYYLGHQWLLRIWSGLIRWKIMTRYSWMILALSIWKWMNTLTSDLYSIHFQYQNSLSAVCASTFFVPCFKWMRFYFLCSIIQAIKWMSFTFNH